MQTIRPNAMRLVGALLLAFFAAGPAHALKPRIEPLSEDDLLRLPLDARDPYERALFLAVEQAEYAKAFDELTQAIEKAPNNAKLRFMAVELARHLGESSYTVGKRGDKLMRLNAVKVLETGILHAKTLIRMASAPPEMRAKAEYALEKLQRQRQYGRQLVLDRLEPKTLKSLPPKAREHYDMAMQLIDRIAYELAFERLERAIEAAPNNSELRFMAIDMVNYLGKVRHQEQAERYYSRAMEHARAILDIPNISLRTRARAEYDLEDLTERHKNLTQREIVRQTYGLRVAKKYAKEIYASDQKPDEARQEALQRALDVLAPARSATIEPNRRPPFDERTLGEASGTVGASGAGDGITGTTPDRPAYFSDSPFN